MSVITDLTRMWLTRTVKPFEFKNEYDQSLPFAECDGLGFTFIFHFARAFVIFVPIVR